jgi:hypothetical protein
VRIARRVDLRKKLANRHPPGGTVHPQGYLDESYGNVNPSPARTGYFAEDGPWVQKPSGKGLRWIRVHAMTAGGGVEGAQLIFQAKRRRGDYHGPMNFENFRRWFIECLLPPIPKASLMVRDKAPYHNVYRDEEFYPTPSTKKADLPSGLQPNPPERDQEARIKAELVAVCRQLCPKPEYELDRLAQAEGHQLLRTPPYHPELQPIEECWAVSKHHCAEKWDYTLQGLRVHLEEGFDKVTSETCRAGIADRPSEEDRYWREDLEESEE